MAIRKINIGDSEISVILGVHDEGYICLTDMVKADDNSERTNIVIQNWMRRKDTISYLGVWEHLHNPNFNCIEFDAIKIRIVQMLPYSKIGNRIFPTHPVLNNDIGAF